VFSLANAAIGPVDLNSDDLDSVSDHLTVLRFSAALIGAAVALALLGRLGAGRLRRAWSLALAPAVRGAAVAGVGNLVEDAFGVSAFGLLFGLGRSATPLRPAEDRVTARACRAGTSCLRRSSTPESAAQRSCGRSRPSGSRPSARRWPMPSAATQTETHSPSRSPRASSPPGRHALVVAASAGA
jgi:hypothetical protein